MHTGIDAHALYTASQLPTFTADGSMICFWSGNAAALLPSFPQIPLFDAEIMGNYLKYWCLKFLLHLNWHQYLNNLLNKSIKK